MKPQVISNAIHLRKPQIESLEILANIANTIPLAKGNDIKASLQAIKEMYPDFGEFERTFPSFCFALATGVGKTRLMGAFIAYLFLEKGIRHFFILAPNLTIHQKLVADFTPNTPKYVFEGLTEFTINAPLILTGDNFDKMSSLIANENTVQINIFNISKINSEERTIKKMSEYLGESYFNYLSGLDDLVLLMDEAHRYRAKAGMKAIEELNPILGLELTATPQVESSNKSIPFKNIIYNYPLFNAMDDGYVKEPAVATRENFDVSKYTDPEKLDQLKLLDGIYIHENAKTELYTYAKNNNKPLVKPFMLVVCKDTSHAEDVVAYIGSDDFFGGVYKDKVITVHSSQKGEEKDETVERLMAVENPDEPTEIVVHVNMLKEGWDVTNLYTIVPLRVANSRTLVEQSIGRGLRLPYGKRTGVSAVDRLTIVAHDRFDEIIREANSGQSIIKHGVVIGRDIPDKTQRVVKNPPLIDTVNMPEEEKPIAKITQEVIKEFESLPSSEKLASIEIKQEIVKRVNEAVNTDKFTQMDELLGNENTDIEHIAKVVERTIDAFTKHTIDIPRVMLVPKSGSANFHYIDFNLDTSKIHKYTPVPSNILLEHLRTHDKVLISDVSMNDYQDAPQNYLMAELLNFNSVDYDSVGDLIHKLSCQMVAFMKSYLSDDDVINVLQYYGFQLATAIHRQMEEHVEYDTVEYHATIGKGFVTPQEYPLNCDKDESIRNFREEVDEKRYIRSIIFSGFSKCIYNNQKFDSDSERLLSVLLEGDSSALKWFKPKLGDFKIHYRIGVEEHQYNPDFVVETSTCKYICEIKRSDQAELDKVQAKAQAAAQWCVYANEHAKQHDCKMWKYLLIPHDEIRMNSTLDFLAEKWGK